MGDLGLRMYNDHEHANTCKNRSSTYKNWENGLVARFNKRLYTMENIMACVLKQIDNKKISYQKIVAFFEENCPSADEDVISLLKENIVCNEETLIKCHQIH